MVATHQNIFGIQQSTGGPGRFLEIGFLPGQMVEHQGFLGLLMFGRDERLRQSMVCVVVGVVFLLNMLKMIHFSERGRSQLVVDKVLWFGSVNHRYLNLTNIKNYL